MALASGARLGPYEIVAPLGAGGMGDVYKARDTRLDRTVAIKILADALAGDLQFRERFEREARTISQLTHAHICTLYDVGQHDSSAFLVLEYLQGEVASRQSRVASRQSDRVSGRKSQVAGQYLNVSAEPRAVKLISSAPARPLT